MGRYGTCLPKHGRLFCFTALYLLNLYKYKGPFFFRISASVHLKENGPWLLHAAGRIVHLLAA